MWLLTICDKGWHESQRSMDSYVEEKYIESFELYRNHTDLRSSLSWKKLVKLYMLALFLFFLLLLLMALLEITYWRHLFPSDLSWIFLYCILFIRAALMHVNVGLLNICPLKKWFHNTSDSGVLASCKFSCLDCISIVRQGQGLQFGTHSVI